MYISNRQKLLIAGVLVLIAVLLLLFFWPAKQKAVRNTAPVATPSTNSQPATLVVPKPTPTVTPEQKSQASAETVAKVFAERYGSYSSESEAANLEDVLPLATSSLAANLNAQITRLQRATTAEVYYGVSTRVLNVTTTMVSETVITASLLTQREEAKGSIENTSVSYQTLVLTLEKSGDDWLVSEATWQ